MKLHQLPFLFFACAVGITPPAVAQNVQPMQTKIVPCDGGCSYSITNPNAVAVLVTFELWCHDIKDGKADKRAWGTMGLEAGQTISRLADKSSAARDWRLEVTSCVAAVPRVPLQALLGSSKWSVTGVGHPGPHPVPWEFQDGAARAAGYWASVKLVPDGEYSVIMTIKLADGVLDTCRITFAPDGRTFSATKDGRLYRTGVRL